MNLPNVCSVNGNQILHVLNRPVLARVPHRQPHHTALVTALAVTVSRTLLGYERTPKVTVYRTAYRTVFITCPSRIAQERTTPSEN